MAASLATLVVIVTLCLASANAQLTSTFYDTSCPNALSLIKSGIKKALASEPRLGASILRLHFHDCFAQGCDGSILLDGSSSEKNAGPNTHSARGFDIIDSIKTQVEAACSGVVSCADILTVAARDSVVELGGPAWTVPLGRRDSKTSNLNAANTNIPSPTSSLGNLTSLFQAQGLSTKDMVALSGAHTIGQARCTVFRNRIYNDANIDSSYAKSVQAKCPSGKTEKSKDFSTLTKSYSMEALLILW
ncbi:hypothetical protein SUGI_0235550 [Cryptomeria japonica]|uniref:peroxidase 2 isoform X2 n=1 Tax=Cryptomeria japonica TaxID=3369 RepID=UPI002408DA76|nr:peroxidase 2 isoform X2 [Cryptomeria japonica]GLJ14549.1 hypothetical protein SUGI_0235550 [Cryptomeria japonica]